MTLQLDGRPSESPYIDMIWRAETIQAGLFISSAASNSELVVAKHKGTTTVALRGPETKASLAEFPDDAEFFGITFKLGTFMPHVAAKNLMDRKDLVLPEARSNAFWLDSSVWQLPNYENADTFVNHLVQKGLLMREPIVSAALEGHEIDLSPRSVQYRFLRTTGLTHSTIRQIERARQATTLLQQGVSILDTTYEAGYADQAHLTRSLKRFMGQTPSQLARVNPVSPDIFGATI